MGAIVLLGVVASRIIAMISCTRLQICSKQSADV
jgi:hypothetical protein